MCLQCVDGAGCEFFSWPGWSQRKRARSEVRRSTSFRARGLLSGQRREKVRARAFAAARLERCPLAVVGVEQPRDVRVKSLVYGSRERLLYFRPGVREARLPVELVLDPKCADRRLRRGNEAGQLGEARTDRFCGAQANCLRDVMQAELPGPQAVSFSHGPGGRNGSELAAKCEGPHRSGRVAFSPASGERR